MATLASTPERAMRPAAVIGDEAEALTVASTITRLFDDGGRPLSGSAAASAVDYVARSGLLGISVPAEFGGLDASNTVLAALCAELAQLSPALAEIAAAQFSAVELLRTDGTAMQQAHFLPAVISGLRFARTVDEDGRRAPVQLPPPDRPWRAAGRPPCSPAADLADWLLVMLRQIGDGPTALLLPVARAAGAPAEAPLSRLRIDLGRRATEGEALGPPRGGPASHPLWLSLDLLLAGAIRLGLARRLLGRAIDHVGSASTKTPRPLDVSPLGRAITQVKAAEAAAEQAGKLVDAAQVGGVEDHRLDAFIAAAAARLACDAAAGEASDLCRRLGCEPADPALDGAGAPMTAAAEFKLLSAVAAYGLAPNASGPA